MRKYVETVIAPNYSQCLGCGIQEVVAVEAAVVSRVATPDALWMREDCHDKEDRFAGALADDRIAVLWKGVVVPRWTHSA
jgi:hypothetical protein